MAFLGLLAGAGLRLLKKKHKRSTPPSSGLTPQEEQDLGVDTMAGFDSEGGVPMQTTAQLPALARTGLGVITTAPAFVERAKCPRGYTFIVTGRPGVIVHAGRPSGTCVLTKVARALGLARRRRGRGISGRDLRAAVRVQRLVHRLGPKFGIHRRSAGHGPGCRCPRCK